ncbi:MAG: 2-phosphosulfolactate phosphatase [Bacteroidota bacterium]
MKTFQIIPTADAIKSEELLGKTAVVIDVLRATSVIVTALQNGARQIRPVAEVEEALQMRSADTLLGGERNAEKIEGFDFGNSPLEYTRDRVMDKEVILTTTNGTRALSNCSRADLVLTSSFLNYRAVCGYLIRSERPVVLICAGTNGEFSLDDFLCAGLMADFFVDSGSWAPNDLVTLAINSWKAAQPDIHRALASCHHYNVLKSKGFEADLRFCLTLDKFDLVPQFDSQEGTIKILDV